MRIDVYRLSLLAFVAFALNACVTASTQYSNTPQAECNRLGLYSGEQFNDCLINMAAVDRAAAQQQKILNCQNAKNNAASNGGGFGAGFVNGMNVNQACN